MRVRPPACVVAVATALCSSLAYGWNGTGHEVVAQVAWDQLTPAERGAAVAMLVPHPRFQKDLMQHLAPGEDPGEHAFREAATWPDTVKSPTNPLERTEDHHAWHYVDYPYDRDGQAGPPPVETWDGQSDPANLLQAWQKVTGELRDPNTAPDRRAIDVCWLLHLAGDVHQPLHAVSLYSKAFPTGDQGGNLVHVRTEMNPNSNLHGVWDGIEGRSFEADAIHKIAERVEKEHPRREFVGRMAEGDVRSWAVDSYRLAKSAAYLDGRLGFLTRDQAADRPEAVPPLPIGYERQARAVADRQIALAGDRLADALRPLLASHPAAMPPLDQLVAPTTDPSTRPTVDVK